MRFLWPRSVEVVYIRAQHPLELPLMQDEHVIEAFTPHTAQEALTDGIGTRSLIRRLEHLDATGLGNPIEDHPKLAIMIPDEIFRTYPKCGGDPSLLCRPRVGGRAREADMDHFA